jgi:hypothetical protein
VEVLHWMASGGGAMTDVVTQHVDSDMGSAEAAQRLAEAARLARE